ncbi:MAG: beta galactosidase jelly roll domain-containing protein [Bryobacterales bacterium]|nr:beta galactosidase jelly roll domain-containing protein [Bryobacterales bacterium]
MPRWFSVVLLITAASRAASIDVTLPPGLVDVSVRARRTASPAAARPSWHMWEFRSEVHAETLSIYPVMAGPAKVPWEAFRVEVRRAGGWRELRASEGWRLPGSLHFRLSGPLEAVRVTSHAEMRVCDVEVLVREVRTADSAVPRFLSLERIDLSRAAAVDLEPLAWRFRGGDDAAWAATDHDDSRWKPIRVGRSWLDQDPARPVGWYRVRFVPPAAWKGSPVALDLGTVSVYGQVYVNGTQVGQFGTRPSGNPFGTSAVLRAVHYVPAELLRYGAANTLAVRCHTGDFGGLYKGPYRIFRLARGTVPGVLLETEWKVLGPDAPLHYLSVHEHLNHYLEGEPVKLLPLATPLLDDPGRVELSYELRDARGRALASGRFEPDRREGRTQRFQPAELNVTTAGKYSVRIACRAGKTELAALDVPFEIAASRSAAAYPVDCTLRGLSLPEPARSLERESIGHYGGNRFRKEGERYVLDYDLEEGNANGNLAHSSLVASWLPGPLLFLHNYKDPPRRLLSAADYMTGITSYRQMEGQDGQWPFGFLGPEHGVLPRAVAVESASWTGVRYTLDYDIGDKGVRLRFQENNLSPAVLVESDHLRAALFSGMSLFGLGHPSRVVFAASNGARSLELGDGQRIDLRDRAENWLLFCFEGAAGFDEFDSAWLVVTEKKAAALEISSAGLLLDYGVPAGRLWVMPLYGQRMLRLAETASWRDGLPGGVLRDVRFWARALLAYPTGVRERYRVMGELHRVVVEEQFEYLVTADAWGTLPFEIAPAPPVLALAARYGFPVVFGQPVEESKLTPLAGPLVFARGRSLRFAIDDIIRLGNEARAAEPGATALARRFRAALNAETERVLDQFHLDRHPWAAELLSEGSRSVAQPGSETPFMIELTLAMPYLDPPLAERARQAVREEIDTFLMKPGNYVAMVNRFTTLPVPVYHLALSRLGIDNMAWSGTHLYALWLYAYTTGDWSLVEKYWNDIRSLFNILPNTADWAFFTPWDILNGVRLGNGIQEVAHGLAGMAAYLRMAARMNQSAERDYAAYLLARQGVSLYAQFVGNRWARLEVPWLASAPWADAVMEAEETAAWRHTEPVEFRGYSLNNIQSRSLIPAASFILTPVPEILRFYRDYAREESRYYWTRILPRIPWEHWSIRDYHGLMVDIADEMHYTIDLPADQVAAVAEREALRSKEWFLGNIPNYRAVLEASGKRGYRRLVWPAATPTAPASKAPRTAPIPQ